MKTAHHEVGKNQKSPGKIHVKSVQNPSISKICKNHWVIRVKSKSAS